MVFTRYLSSFFFSSRRRHTILTCDWSSDVCSSDLSRPRCSARLFDPGPEENRRAEHRGLEAQRREHLACDKDVQWLPGDRSEERRVGKECGFWMEAHYR